MGKVFESYPLRAAPSYWDKGKDEAVYDFTKLNLQQLKEYWVMLEQCKHECHPESGFQPLFDSEMRQLKDEILKRKK